MEKPPLRVVTAASEGYRNSLRQLLANLRPFLMRGEITLQVFDLGLTPETTARLKTLAPGVTFRHFPFHDYPDHVRLLHNFAWKVLAIHQAYAESGAHFLWLDAASLIRQDFSELLNWLARNPVYALRGANTVGMDTASTVCQRLSVEQSVANGRIRVAGLLGLRGQSKEVVDLLDAWKALALEPQYIDPRLSAGDRHRFDQSLLSILLLCSEQRGTITLPDADVDISAPWPVRWVSTRNKIPPDAPGWSFPLWKAYFVLYKWADQRLWRLKHTLRKPYKQTLGGA